ncbi:MAG: class I SAM-dependent methyltransferase [Gammaproteobacteria bacterium]
MLDSAMIATCVDDVRAAIGNADFRTAEAILSDLLRRNEHAAVLRVVDNLGADTPNNSNLLAIRAAALVGVGRLDEALTLSLSLPDERLQQVANVLASMENVETSEQLETELCRILASDRHFHPRFTRVLFAVFRDKIRGWQATGAGVGLIERDPLFHSLLRTIDLTAVEFEIFLTGLRQRLLRLALESSDAPISALDTMLSIAIQCHGNEYAYYVASEEAELLRALDRDIATRLPDSAPLTVLVLAALMYRAPESSEWAADLTNVDFSAVHVPTQRFVRSTLDAYHAEIALARSFESQCELDNDTSLRVGAMYEENPYPRWRFSIPLFNRGGKSIVAHDKLTEAAGWDPRGADVHRVLVAGCGTGLGTVTTAANFPDLQLTAIDISTRSLAYGALKARELGISNVEFERRDILQLPSWERSFDMIEAGGVIHHMAEPDDGLRSMLACLRPHGIVKLGLYSARARASIVRLREAFRAEFGSIGPAEIREVRHRILGRIEDSEYAEFSRLRDFYSSSGCRDLLLHEHECQYSIPELAELLNRHGLRFLRFAEGGGIYQTFHALRGAAADVYDLDQWHDVESRAPSMFAGMYVFFAQSID